MFCCYSWDTSHFINRNQGGVDGGLEQRGGERLGGQKQLRDEEEGETVAKISGPLRQETHAFNPDLDRKTYH